MKLYTDYKGRWAGTQSDAKKFDTFEQVEVPTDKPNLLEFLNDYLVAAAGGSRIEVPPIETRHPQSCSAKDLNGWDVKDVVLNCRKEHLGGALAAIISRLHDELGEIE